MQLQSDKHSLQKFFSLAVGITLALPLGAAVAQAKAEPKAAEDGLVELMPAVRVSKEDAELIEKNQKVLQSNQQLIEKVLTHLGVAYYEPKLPTYRALGANTILTLLDQVYYAAAAKKLGASLPESYNEPSGTGMVNNRFLHLYNNEILRSIAKKLDVSVPEKVPQAGSVSAFSHKVIVQNHEILTAVAAKLGVKP